LTSGPYPVTSGDFSGNSNPIKEFSFFFKFRKKGYCLCCLRPERLWHYILYGIALMFHSNCSFSFFGQKNSYRSFARCLIVRVLPAFGRFLLFVITGYKMQK
jgi:hypothetical protein